MDDVEKIAGKLTKAQRGALMRYGEGVFSRTRIHCSTFRSMFQRGLVGELMAGRHRFFSWTPLGLAVKAHLLAQESSVCQE